MIKSQSPYFLTTRILAVEACFKCGMIKLNGICGCKDI